MSFKKYDGSVWQSINPKKLKGIPYTGTLPAVLTGTKAGYLHHYKIYGNLTQDGTPTPENPIVPSGCGVRTENLFDKNNTEGIENNCYISQGTGNIVAHVQYYITAPIAVTSGETYYWVFHLTSGGVTSSMPTVGFFDANDNQIGVASHSQLSPFFSFIPPANCAYIRASVYKSDINEAMLVKSSTAPTSYTPYGYKLPLTVNGTEYPIYLGESQTTRRIKKLVLDGTENWSHNATYHTFSLALSDLKTSGLRKTTLYCSHYMTIDDGRPISNVPNNSIYTDQVISIYIMTDAYTTTTNFKAYLAAQYAAGTPVTVWYVLAEPEAGIVNEPLMKIGNYADTIDSTQTNVQIPTSAGSTTISWAGQGLEPSEFDSIQEWVDTPTYKCVNGEWVEE